jgi:hypothetical protein
MVAIALLAFFVLGWSYYMVASILMKGSIFAPLREYLSVCAENSGIRGFFCKMLQCLMCTATQAALWTLGLTSGIIGVCYRIPSHVITVMAGRPVLLSTVAEFFIAFAAAFALSLAVAGEAWVINLAASHRSEQILRLHKEKGELLARILLMEVRGLGNKSKQEIDLD